ncbi:SDR family oxidoreductase [uncultured Roseibium sp.]|uniref:SDR family oxidoreductase n=1 Tax=uncultured Roseibium sp. TaxID=1936171 RepID=UPI0032180B46
MAGTRKKVAIVTGASRGIGAAIAERLASDGFAVVINYAGNAKAAADLAGKIENAGGTAVTAQADVSNPEEVARLFDSAETAFGGVDVIVNNAGIMKLAPIAGSDDALFDSTVAINLKGSFNVMREAARRVRSGGRIINMSTTVIAVSLPTYGVYGATKAGVEAMTRILAKEMRGRDVCVNAVAPGPTGTDLFLNGKTDEQVAALSKMNPLERLGAPDDIANAVSFLAGPEGGWINGQILRANGGMA